MIDEPTRGSKIRPKNNLESPPKTMFCIQYLLPYLKCFISKREFEITWDLYMRPKSTFDLYLYHEGSSLIVRFFQTFLFFLSTDQDS